MRTSIIDAGREFEKEKVRMPKTRKILRRVGDIVAIPLRDGTFGFGRVLHEPLVAFYDLQKREMPALDEIVSSSVAFIVFVMNYPITRGDWPVLGNFPLSPELVNQPLFFKKDPITNRLSIYKESTGEEMPASQDDCKGLECAAVWEQNHIVDRLIDHFAGRPNKWVESMRL